MKSSPYRKRYILIHSDNMGSIAGYMEKELHRVFRARRRYVDGNYAIFLTNQFYRDQVVEYINSNIRGARTVVTSGTIKKCKSRIASMEEAQLPNPNL